MGLLDLGLGGGTQNQAVPREKSKSAQEQIWITECFGLAEEDKVADHGKFRIREARAQTLKLPVERGARSGQFLKQLGADAMNLSRVAEINAHPVGWRKLRGAR